MCHAAKIYLLLIQQIANSIAKISRVGTLKVTIAFAEKLIQSINLISKFFVRL